MKDPSVLVLGGGLAGMSAAYTLARAGWKNITVLERSSEPGGLAGSLQRGDHCYPLAYHHILHRDRTLLYFLDAIGALPSVRWRRIRVLFRANGRLYDLRNPLEFLRFPMSVTDKLRFARLMARCYRKREWDDWLDRGGAELIDRWAGPGVRRAIFEPLCRLKFDLPASEVSAAWLGARLYFREGADPLGYIPETNWTKVLCDGIADLLDQSGVQLRLRTAVATLHTEEDRVQHAVLDNGERIGADYFVSALPTPVYLGLVPEDRTTRLNSIRYTGVISTICGTQQTIDPDFYWMNLTSLDCQASGLFMLNSLNPGIGTPGEACLNFVNHVQSSEHELFHRGDEELLAGYAADFKRIFGTEMQSTWHRVTRLGLYSPVFVREYRNPPLRSSTWTNVFFAGNYRTFPSAATTGTALWSGIEAADAMLRECAQRSDLPSGVGAFRLKSQPRA